MRITELRRLLAENISDSDTFSRDRVIAQLGGRTVNQALDAGDEPADIWRAVRLYLTHEAYKPR